MEVEQPPPENMETEDAPQQTDEVRFQSILTKKIQIQNLRENSWKSSFCLHLLYVSPYFYEFSKKTRETSAFVYIFFIYRSILTNRFILTIFFWKIRENPAFI